MERVARKDTHAAISFALSRLGSTLFADSFADCFGAGGGEGISGSEIKCRSTGQSTFQILTSRSPPPVARRFIDEE